MYVCLRATGMERDAMRWMNRLVVSVVGCCVYASLQVRGIVEGEQPRLESGSGRVCRVQYGEIGLVY